VLAQHSSFRSRQVGCAAPKVALALRLRAPLSVLAAHPVEAGCRTRAANIEPHPARGMVPAVAPTERRSFTDAEASAAEDERQRAPLRTTDEAARPRERPHLIDGRHRVGIDPLGAGAPHLNPT